MSGYNEEGYRNMLSTFRTNDLTSLLGAFGRNKAGRKSELKERALDLLKTRPTGFNFSAYLSKIVEIYSTIQNDAPSNDMLRNMMQNPRQFMNMNLAQQQRMYQPPQYGQQQMHTIMRPGLPPQMMPQMQRGMYGNNSNNIQYNYQSIAPRSMSQMPSNQQHNMTMNQMGYDLNLGANSYNQPVQTQANVKFKKLPFYEIFRELVPPSTLIGTDRCTLQNVPRGMREAVLKFSLEPDEASLMGMNRDISNGKNEYIYQIQIRICALEGGPEVTDCMPLGLHIRVGNKVCPLPPTIPNTRPGTEARRISRPINCTLVTKINPNIANNVTVNWTPDSKNYAVGINFVKKLTSEILLKRLQDKGTRSSEETKNNIIQKLADVDPDLATTSYRFSLVCPLGKMRMQIPAKSINCDHLQCFDAHIFILMNEKKPTWMCPTCNKSCLYDDILIESYFLDIVTSPNLPDSSKEIEILADGTWRVYEEEKEAKNLESTPDIKDKPIDSVDLDDSDDGGDENNVEPKKETNPESSKDPENLKSSFVDLTLSDDEEPPKEKDKQENEAQAADVEMVATVVDSKPQAQVQPQQAVTSSVQGVVIEIDSPSPPTSPVPPTTSAS